MYDSDSSTFDSTESSFFTDSSESAEAVETDLETWTESLETPAPMCSPSPRLTASTPLLHHSSPPQLSSSSEAPSEPLTSPELTSADAAPLPEPPLTSLSGHEAHGSVSEDSLLKDDAKTKKSRSSSSGKKKRRKEGKSARRLAKASGSQILSRPSPLPTSQSSELAVSPSVDVIGRAASLDGSDKASAESVLAQQQSSSHHRRRKKELSPRPGSGTFSPIRLPIEVPSPSIDIRRTRSGSVSARSSRGAQSTDPAEPTLRNLVALGSEPRTTREAIERSHTPDGLSDKESRKKLRNATLRRVRKQPATVSPGNAGELGSVARRKKKRRPGIPDSFEKSPSPSPSDSLVTFSDGDSSRMRAESLSDQSQSQSFSEAAGQVDLNKKSTLLKRKSSSLTTMQIAREMCMTSDSTESHHHSAGLIGAELSASGLSKKHASSTPHLASLHSAAASSSSSSMVPKFKRSLDLDENFKSKLLTMGKETSVKPGSIIVKQRTRNSYVYCILQGKVLETSQWIKSEKIVSTLVADEWFGHMSALLNIHSETNYIAAEASTVLRVISLEEILQEASTDVEFSAAFMRALAVMQAKEIQQIPFEAIFAFQKLSIASTQAAAAETTSPLIPGHTITERVLFEFKVQIGRNQLFKKNCNLFITENHIVCCTKELDSYQHVIDISEIRSRSREAGKVKISIRNVFASPGEPAEKLITFYLKLSDAEELMKLLHKREQEANSSVLSFQDQSWSLSQQDMEMIWKNSSQVVYRHGDQLLPAPASSTSSSHVWLYQISTGRLSLMHKQTDVSIGSATLGDFFGEMHLLTGEEDFHGQVDSLDLTAKRVDSVKLMAILKENPAVAGKFFFRMCRLFAARYREYILKRIDALLGSDVQWLTFPRADVLSIIEQVDADTRLIRGGGMPISNRLYLACEAGQTALVQAILSRKPPVQMLNGSNDRNQWTCLHAALAEGHLEVAELLLRTPGLDVRLANKDNNMPIHFLVRQKPSLDPQVNSLQSRLFEMLIQKGASIYSRNAAAEYPIHIASWKGNSVLVRACLKHQCSPNLTNKRGETALHYAAVLGNVECAQNLIDAGIDRWISNDECQTALDFARGGSKTTFMALFQTSILNPDDILNELFAATDAGKMDQVGDLLSVHTDANTVSTHPKGILNTPVNSEGMTLPMIAAARSHVSLLHMFLSSTVHTVDPTCVSADGNSILHLLCRHTPKRSLATATYTSILKRLNEKCSFLPNNSGELPYHLAVLHNAEVAVNYWLHLGYPLAYKTTKGLSVLDYAVIAGNISIAGHLATAAVPKTLSTFALETAHRTNQEELFTSWLKKGPAPTIPRWGSTPEPLPDEKEKEAASSTDEGNLHLERFDRDPRKEFQILQQLGQGACGAVLKARHTSSGALVAIKQIKAQTQAQANIKNEIDILEGCQHENIVQYRGCFFMGGNEIWLVMQYCGVGALSGLVQTLEDPLNEGEISAILGGVLSGLGYLHHANLIHRDMKPQNVLIDDSGEVKIADFGVSTQLGRENTQEVGTPLYMSPEVLDGAPYDARSDIWALGIMAIELAEGKPPHADEHMLKVMVLVSEGPAPTFANPNRFTGEFQQFINLCLRKNPDERASTTDLLGHPFIVQHQRDRMAVLQAMVEKFHARKAQKREEEFKIERQKLLLMDVENFLGSLKNRSFHGNPKAFEAAMAKCNQFVNDLVETCRFIDEGKQHNVEKHAAEAMIIQIASAKQALSAKHPGDSVLAESTEELAESTAATSKRAPGTTSTGRIKKPKSLSDKEWQAIASKLAEVDSLRATTQQLVARISALETTIATLMQVSTLAKPPS